MLYVLYTAKPHFQTSASCKPAKRKADWFCLALDRGLVLNLGEDFCTRTKRDESDVSDFDIAPDPHRSGLTTSLSGVDATGQPVDLPVVTEKPLTIYLNRQEIVTAMTLGDRPEPVSYTHLTLPTICSV